MLVNKSLMIVFRIWLLVVRFRFWLLAFSRLFVLILIVHKVTVNVYCDAITSLRGLLALLDNSVLFSKELHSAVDIFIFHSRRLEIQPHLTVIVEITVGRSGTTTVKVGAGSTLNSSSAPG